MYGQLVIGPPGSGKSTYCAGMDEFLTAIKRSPCIINLDPASAKLPYECAVDVRDLITCTDVMEGLGLGPNGGLLYCIDFLRENLDWLDAKLHELFRANPQGLYLLIDCPGQAELFTLSESFLQVVKHLTGKHGIKLAAVHLVDAHHCSDATKIVSAALLSLNTMMRLELPHINIMSKIDIAEAYGPLPFDLEFFAALDEPSRLLALLEAEGERRVAAAAAALGIKDHRPTRVHAPGEWDGDVDMDDEGPGPAATGTAESCSEAEGAAPSSSPSSSSSSALPGSKQTGTAASKSPAALLEPVRRFVRGGRALHAALVGLLDDFGLVGFRPLNIMDKESVIAVTRAVDKANGYAFGALHDGSDVAIGAAAASWRSSARGSGSEEASSTPGLRGVVSADDALRDAKHLQAASSKYLSGM